MRPPTSSSTKGEATEVSMAEPKKRRRRDSNPRERLVPL
jgi:hypothetical protein